MHTRHLSTVTVAAARQSELAQQLTLTEFCVSLRDGRQTEAVIRVRGHRAAAPTQNLRLTRYRISLSLSRRHPAFPLTADVSGYEDQGWKT